MPVPRRMPCTAALLGAILLVMSGPVVGRGTDLFGAEAHAASCTTATRTAKFSNKIIVATVVTTWCFRKGNVISRHSVPSAHPTTLAQLGGLKAEQPKLQFSACDDFHGYPKHNCLTRWQFSFSNHISPFAPSIGLCLHSRIYGNGAFRTKHTTDCSAASTSTVAPPDGSTGEAPAAGEAPVPSQAPVDESQPQAAPPPPPPSTTPASSTTLAGDGSYAAMWADRSTLSGCDRDADGHKAYLRRFDVWGSPYPAVYDPDGAGGACVVVAVNDWPLGSYNICVQQEGCAAPVYRAQF